MKVKSNERRKNVRFLVLFLACMAIFADYYIMDIPALIKTELVDSFKDIYGQEKTEFYYSFLYSFYSIPNVILPLFGGILVDELGYRTMTIVFLSFISLGQFVVCLGIFHKNFWSMIIGRFIFGIGGESLNISITSLIITWFQQKEVSFAQSINLSLIRVASVLNTIITPQISLTKGMEFAFYFGLVICAFSLLTAILLVYIDSKLPSQSAEQKEKNSEEKQLTMANMGKIIKQVFRNIQAFDSMFWSLTFLMVVLYVCVLTFNTFSSTIIIDMWLPKENTMQQNQTIAGQMMSVPYIMATLLFPVFGLVTDKYGNRVTFLILSSILIIGGYVCLLTVNPLYCFVLLGISYSMFGAVVWPTVSYIVSEKKIGIAYGVMTSIQNMGMGFMPIIIAAIQIEYSTQMVALTFLGLAVCGLLLALSTNLLDRKRQVSLNCGDQDKLVQYMEELQENHYKLGKPKQSKETGKGSDEERANLMGNGREQTDQAGASDRPSVSTISLLSSNTYSANSADYLPDIIR